MEEWQTQRSGERHSKSLRAKTMRATVSLASSSPLERTPMPARETEHYFRRFGYYDRLIPTAPEPDLGIVVVIPCFNEPDLIASLESLWLCERPECPVEVIVVVNSPDGCP